MTPMTHGDARNMLNLSLDARLSGADRRALDEHLAACDSCSAYAADLQRLNAHLFESLQARWADPNYSSLELDRGLRLTGQRVRQRTTQRRLLLRAQPAVWTLGAIALISLMAFIISAVRPKAAADPTGTPTENIVLGATASPSIATTATQMTEPTRGICTAQVIESADLYKGPNTGYVVERVLAAGMTGQVLARYGAASDTWLQVYFKESDDLEYVGWLQRATVNLTGDCGSLSQSVPTATQPPDVTDQPASANLSATATLPPVSETPIFDPNGVCFVAPGDFGPAERLNVYSGPGSTYSVVGQLSVGEYVQAVGIFSQPNYNTWIGVHFENEDRMSWVDGTYYMFDGRGTNGCWPLPAVEVYPAPPTFTPSPTYMATAVIPSDIDVNDVIYVNDSNPNAQLARSLPTAGGSRTTTFGVRINDVPPGEKRTLNISFVCSGGPPPTPGPEWQDLWGIYGDALNMECNSSYSTTEMTQNNNFVGFVVRLSDSLVSLNYTVYATLSR